MWLSPPQCGRHQRAAALKTKGAIGGVVAAHAAGGCKERQSRRRLVGRACTAWHSPQRASTAEQPHCISRPATQPFTQPPTQTTPTSLACPPTRVHVSHVAAAAVAAAKVAGAGVVVAHVVPARIAHAAQGRCEGAGQGWSEGKVEGAVRQLGCSPIQHARTLCQQHHPHEHSPHVAALVSSAGCSAGRHTLHHRHKGAVPADACAAISGGEGEHGSCMRRQLRGQHGAPHRPRCTKAGVALLAVGQGPCRIGDRADIAEGSQVRRACHQQPGGRAGREGVCGNQSVMACQGRCAKAGEPCWAGTRHPGCLPTEPQRPHWHSTAHPPHPTTQQPWLT